MTTSDLSRGPHLRFPPVMVFFVGFGVGMMADLMLPLPVFGRFRYWLVPGVLLVGFAAVLVGWAGAVFLKRGTAIYPISRANTLVTVGPYRVTRNPMYVAMSAAYAGLALIGQLHWTLLLLPVVMTACYRLVIRPEEAYLAAEFGEAYRSYKESVRRWI